jgi:hypothetical protein
MKEKFAVQDTGRYFSYDRCCTQEDCYLWSVSTRFTPVGTIRGSFSDNSMIVPPESHDDLSGETIIIQDLSQQNSYIWTC